MIIVTSVAIMPNAYALIIVSELQTFSLGRWALGSGDITANQNICIGLRPRGPYSVTVSGDTSGGRYAIKNITDAITYRLFFNDRPRTNGREELKPGEALVGQRGRRIRPNGTCKRPTANLSLLIPQANLMAASAGRYSATIVLLVSPE